MAHKFSFSISGDATSVVQNVEKQLRAAGGKFSGNASGGSFEGKSPLGQIEGRYEVVGNLVTVTITKKPFVVPHQTVESKIREYFSRA